ncbi:hypothetical protein P3X46_007010 [Hevea brasiliensis]|uniref:Fatty acid desaturase domain-containing protein n=1 Tax=Hevea brasiliensis TaxID=3981 RepID=A0ABQ9MUL5_HEVBR|nr:hypothetical protein P3X46_007010 [Hevea brasiliensis]
MLLVGWPLYLAFNVLGRPYDRFACHYDPYDTHVFHHLFSTMPHYNAIEATKAIKHLLGEYYKFDATSIYKAQWRDTKECLYVKLDDGAPNQGVF